VSLARFGPDVMFLVVLTYTQYTQLQFVLVYAEFVNYYVSLL